MKIILNTLIIFLLFSLPAFAEENPATCHAIVSDYKNLESMLNSGAIHQARYKAELDKLQKRAKIQWYVSAFEIKKRSGRLNPGDTFFNQPELKFWIEPACKTQEEMGIFHKINMGFDAEPI